LFLSSGAIPSSEASGGGSTRFLADDFLVRGMASVRASVDFDFVGFTDCLAADFLVRGMVFVWAFFDRVGMNV
jgi:hypothetical protein